MAVLLAPFNAGAQDAAGLSHGNGKLILTSGVGSIDGAAGGGLVPWAVTGSYAASDEFGGTATVSRLRTRDYVLTGAGAAASLGDRAEISYAQQRFDAGVVVSGTTLKLDIVGVKWRIAGDAVLDADSWMPQLAFGLEWKRLDPGAAVGGVLDSVGAARHGTDLYVSATKLLLGQSVLVNGTLRLTKANQNGLLGFGSVDSGRYTLQPETSVAWLLSRHVAAGVEYRAKPDKLRFAGEAFREDDWKDLFVAWAPNKRVSLTAAWVDLGNVVGHERQQGLYVSAQFAF